MSGPFASIIAARKSGGWLHFTNDVWSIAYLFIATILLLVHWSLGHVHWPIVALSCAMAYGTGCILHDHAHMPMWRSRWLNQLTSYWIAALRGDGVWSWVPTHINNHHVYANLRGDLTLTWRWTPRFHFVGLIAYTATGCLLYGVCALRYLAHRVLHNPRRSLRLLMQPALSLSVISLALAIDAHRALWIIVVPHLFGIVAMIATGYMQHHHTITSSSWAHSRDFTGRLNNILHFNHGFHTVHHIDQRLHWSEWPRAHALILQQLDPRLIEPSLPRYLLRVFFGSLIVPRWRSIDLSLYHPEPNA